MTEPTSKRYRGPGGKIIFAAQVLGENYCAVWRKPNGSLCRQRSPLLSMHATLAGAQVELDYYAHCVGWTEVN